MHLNILKDIFFLLGFSVIIVFVLQRLRLPSILGFLITGILIGPNGLGLLKADGEVELLSEIGIIFLLFVIGLEMSIKSLINIKKTVFLGGSFQVAGTVVVTAMIALILGYPSNTAVFIGFLFSLSSTAIVLKVFQERNELSTPHARNALGILIFQDMIVVPMMLLTPLLARQGRNLTADVSLLLAKLAGVVLISVIGGKYVVPKALYAVAKTKNKELFLLTTITICFSVVILTSQAGLSLALGAFLAGLIISESEYSQQAASSILPFRELFMSFFFISVGMLLDLEFFITNFWVVLSLITAVFLIKSFITAAAVWVLRYPSRTLLLTGISLFQIGEFSFILSKTGVTYGLINAEVNQYFLAVSIGTMLLTPFVIIFSEKITTRIFRLRVIKFLLKKSRNPLGIFSDPRRKVSYKNHLIIVGYGMSGSLLARAAEYKKIPYIVIELNADTVNQEKKKGVPIIYGDATHEHILEAAHLSTARCVVVVISDQAATRMVVSAIRSLSSVVYVLVRTRYVKEINDFDSLGADDIVPEEFEASLQIFSRVMNNFLIPEDDIENFIETLRTDNHFLFHGSKKNPKTFRLAKFPEFSITSLRVTKVRGDLIGKSLRELNLRKDYGINVLGISRKNKMIEQVSSEEKLCLDDVVYIHGKPEDISQFQTLIN